MGSSSVQAALVATLKSINVNPIRKGDGKVDEGVGFEVTLISPPGHEDVQCTPGAPKRFLRSQSGTFGGSNILEPQNFIFDILKRNEEKKLC